MRYDFAPIKSSTTCENLSQTHPEVAAEWDYEKNSPLTPENVTKGQTKKYGGVAAKVIPTQQESTIVVV